MSCQEAHPDLPDVSCDKSPHPFGAHMNRATGKSWAGERPPLPASTKKGSTLVVPSERIAEAGTRTRTGPPDTQSLKDTVLERTWEATPEQAKEVLTGAIREVAKTGKLFTADDVVGMLPEGARDVIKGNQIGAAFSAAAKAGLIAKTGFVPSKGLKGHGRIIHQWVGI